MQKTISLILLIPGILFAGIESSNPTPEELVEVLNYEAWKLELDSLDNIEFKVEFYRYNDFKSGVSGNTFGDNLKNGKRVYIVIFQDDSVSIKFFSDKFIGGSGGNLLNHYENVSQSMSRIELPKELEIGNKYPILNSDSDRATVYLSIQHNQ